MTTDTKIEDDGYQAYYDSCAKDCHCCGVCSNVVCGGILQGACCEQICRCVDDYQDEPDRRADFDPEDENG